jgi:hypothetical protein
MAKKNVLMHNLTNSTVPIFRTRKQFGSSSTLLIIVMTLISRKRSFLKVFLIVAYIYSCVKVKVCVCVREREREKKRERKKEREREGERERESKRGEKALMLSYHK